MPTVVVAVVLWVVAGLAAASCGGSKSAAGAGDGRYQRAPMVETTEEALKTEVQMIHAKMSQEVGRSAEAQAQYRAIVQQHPNHAAALYELSRIMEAENRLDSAIHYAERAAANGRDVVWYQLQLASLYRNAQEADKCVKQWEMIVKRWPDNLNYYYELSNAYLRKEDLKGAIEVLNRVEKRVGISEEVSMQKAKLWRAAGREDKVLEEIAALSEAMPQESQYNIMLADSYMKNKDYAKALAYYNRALEHNPNDPYAHIALAEYYKSKGQARKAYEELKSAFSSAELTTTNKIQTLTNFYTSEEFYGIHSSFAYSLLEQVMQQSDDSTSYAAFYGDVLMRQGKYSEAHHQFALALTKDSSKYELWEAMLVSEMKEAKDSERLQRDAERAEALFPLHPLPKYIQAVLAYDAGDYNKALEQSLRCENLGFDKGYLESETYLLIAESYSRLKDARCLDYYKRFLEMHPKDLQVMNSYAYQLALNGKELDTAERLSKQTLSAQPNNPYFQDTYAWILHLQGRDEAAWPYIEKAAKQLPDDEETAEHLRVIKEKLNK